MPAEVHFKLFSTDICGVGTHAPRACRPKRDLMERTKGARSYGFDLNGGQAARRGDEEFDFRFVVFPGPEMERVVVVSATAEEWLTDEHFGGGRCDKRQHRAFEARKWTLDR